MENPRQIATLLFAVYIVFHYGIRTIEWKTDYWYGYSYFKKTTGASWFTMIMIELIAWAILLLPAYEIGVHLSPFVEIGGIAIFELLSLLNMNKVMPLLISIRECEKENPEWHKFVLSSYLGDKQEESQTNTTDSEPK